MERGLLAGDCRLAIVYGLVLQGFAEDLAVALSSVFCFFVWLIGVGVGILSHVVCAKPLTSLTWMA